MNFMISRVHVCIQMLTEKKHAIKQQLRYTEKKTQNTFIECFRLYQLCTCMENMYPILEGIQIYILSNQMNLIAIAIKNFQHVSR